MADAEKQPLAPAGKEETPEKGSKAMDCFLRNISYIARLFGWVVLAVMWAATVTTLQGQTKGPTYIKYYLIAASLVVTFFELTWIMDKMVCCVRQGCCCKCWSFILWIDGWRKFLIYTGLSVPLFLQGIDGILHVVTGFCLLVLACLYLVQSFGPKAKRRDEHTPIPGSVTTMSAVAQASAASVIRHEMSTQTDVISEQQDDVRTKERVTPKPKSDTRPAEKSKTESKQEQPASGTNPFDDDSTDVNEDSAANDVDTMQNRVKSSESAT